MYATEIRKIRYIWKVIPTFLLCTSFGHIHLATSVVLSRKACAYLIPFPFDPPSPFTPLGIPCSTPAPANTNQATAVTGVYEDEVTVTCTTGHCVTGQDNTVTSFSMTCGADGQWGNVTDCERKPQSLHTV